MDQNKINRIIEIVRANLYEEVPTMALAHGNIAGTPEAGDDPPVRKRKRKKDRKYIKGPGRKVWLDYLSSLNGTRS